MQRQRLQGLTKSVEVWKPRVDGESFRQLTINLGLAAAERVQLLVMLNGRARRCPLATLRPLSPARETALMSMLQQNFTLESQPPTS